MSQVKGEAEKEREKGERGGGIEHVEHVVHENAILLDGVCDPNYFPGN